MKELELFFKFVKDELYKSDHERGHPFRLCTLGTLGEYPDLRTLVKRESSENLEFLFYTDSRSPKIDLLKKNPNSSLHFYHPQLKLQVSIQGRSEIIIKGDLFEKHKEIALKNPSDYASSLPPSSKIDLKEYETTSHTHFCLLKFNAISIQALQLDKPRHQRAIWYAKDDWAGTWLVP